MANQSGAKFAEPAPPAAAAGRGRARRGRHATAATGAAATTAAAGAAAAATTRRAARRRERGTPANNATAGLNAQVRQTPPSRPGGAPMQVAAAAAAAPALYAQICVVCHAAGVAGAPKLGDKAAWAPRLAQGIDGLTASVIKGKGAMPPKGGSTASDADIRAVVSYMVGTVK